MLSNAYCIQNIMLDVLLRSSHFVFKEFCKGVTTVHMLKLWKIKRREWEKFKVVSEAGSPFEMPACLCFASAILSGWNGLRPDFAWNVVSHHLAQYRFLGVKEGGMGSSLWKTACLPPFFLMSPWVFSCCVCAHSKIRKYFIVYVLIAHYVFLFLVRCALMKQGSRVSYSLLYFQGLEDFLAESNCLGSTISN